jgi:uncharacterized repeat protein (TIGR03803 family)
LARDAAGNLYGTTSSGGNGDYPVGFGTVFKVDAAGNETVLHHFTGGEGGAVPAGGVLLDSQGNLYGVTTYGGLPPGDPNGSGTVFRLEADGTFTTLHRFAANGSEGTGLRSGLVQDAAGNLYGVTSSGGAGGGIGRGTVFRIDSAGVFTTLHDFSTNTVAARPIGPLMRDDAGSLYGVTERGGAGGGGTIFRLDPEGVISILHEFAFNPFDPFDFWSKDPGGSIPLAGLVGDPTGIVYGTTRTGGSSHRGIVYRFDMRSNALEVLLTFTAEQGGYVEAPLLRDSAGVLYGTTWPGGDLTCNPPIGCGTVFRIDTSPIGGAMLVPSAATTHIQNADGPGLLTFGPFSDAPIRRTEGTSNIRVPVYRTSGSAGAVSVGRKIVYTGYAPRPGADFVVSGTLAWANGDTAAKFINVDYLEDAFIEPAESFTIELTAPTGGATIPSNLDRRQVMVILDNDEGLGLSDTAISVNEYERPVQIVIVKRDALNLAASVDFATTNGTAVAGSDYTATSGTLTWAAGESGPKTIEITITDDQVDEKNESFTVSLSNSTGGFALGPNSIATVTILDNDTTGGGGGGATGFEMLALLGLLKIFAPRVRQIRRLEPRPGVP